MKSKAEGLKKTKSRIHKNKALFVDVDYTLIKGNTVLAFLKFMFIKGELSLVRLFKLSIDYHRKKHRLRRTSFKRIEKNLRKYTKEEEEKLEREYFEKELKPRLNKKVLRLIEEYRRKGYLTIIATATPCQLIKSLIKFIKADDKICSLMRTKDENFIIDEFTYSSEKAKRIEELSQEKNIDLKESVGLTDSIEDLPMTQVLGKVTLVNPDRRIERIGIKKHWRIIRGG